MSKKLYFLISFTLLLCSAGIIYGQGPLYLDFDKSDEVVTEPNFTSFLISDSGTTISDITINLSGTLESRLRPVPTGVPYESIYRDFIFGSGGPITVMLSGLGAGRECEITIYAYDGWSGGGRGAVWFANGSYLFIAEFDNTVPPTQADSYAFTGTGYADIYGNLVLTCYQYSGSPYAFLNALVVEPQGDYVPVKHSHDPQPLDGQEDVPVDAVLSWEAGETATAHDVYLATDFNDVSDANRSSPLGVLVSQGQGGTNYDPSGYLKLGTTYYWRVDEVNEPNVWKGAVWSFTTQPTLVVEDFDSYADNSELKQVWEDNTTNGSRAFISLENDIVRDGNSLKYEYKNATLPHYSEAYADIADLGVEDSDWLGMDANALVIYFYGDPNNKVSEHMYVSLTDGDASPHTGTVYYPTMLDVTIPQWHKWSIPLTEFGDVNLANVVGVSIGFASFCSYDGIVYIDNIVLDAEAEQTTTAVGGVNWGTVYQQLEGFGGAAVYEPQDLVSHPKSEEIYDLLFKELDVEILRIRNTYGYSNDPNNIQLAATAEIVAEAREAGRKPSLKTELCPWSPPYYLKSNWDESGGGTLVSDSNDANNSPPYYYAYTDYAQWWYDSLVAWEANGVVPDFISIQNEPSIETGYDSCKLVPEEGPDRWWWRDPNINFAGYDKAHEAVWQKLHDEMGPDMPEMWISESCGFWDLPDYIDDPNSIIDMNHVDGFAHHLYDGAYPYDDPDSMIGILTDIYNDYGYKPLHMTEYVKLSTIPNFDMGMKFAWHIYNCLYYLHSNSFFNWTLFRGVGFKGGIVTLTTANDYIIRPQYWFLKGYTHFTDKDWYVLGTSVSGPGAENLRMSAFTSPDNTEVVIVILNKSKDRTVLTIPGLTPENSAVYRSGQTLMWADYGAFTSEMSLPPESITTIWMDNKRPIANAGPDQEVNASEGAAEVTLDGSDSNDVVGNPLTYSWSWVIDGNVCEVNGVNPVIELPIGLHTIELIVSDGLLDSESDYVDVNVVPCLSSEATEYDDWVAAGAPDCWCYERQCRGDADGLEEPLYWVHIPDLYLLKLSYAKTDAVLEGVQYNGAGGICADFDHQKQLVFRVYSDDLAILKSYYAEPSVPCCDNDGDCVLEADDRYNFWTYPQPIMR